MAIVISLNCRSANAQVQDIQIRLANTLALAAEVMAKAAAGNSKDDRPYYAARISLSKAVRLRLCVCMSP